MPLEIDVVLDNREKEDLRQVFQDNISLLPFTLENLTLGDVEFRERGTGRCLLRLERKTWSDLAGSIKSKHWRNQKVRLMADTTCPCGFIIEGNFSNAPDQIEGLDKGILFSALANTYIRDGLAFFCTESPVGTWLWVKSFAEKIGEHGGFGGLGKITGQAAGVNSYLETVKSIKAKNITADNALELTLAQYPGISAKVGAVIQASYPSMAALVHSYDSCSSEKKAQLMLQDIVVKEASDGVKARRLGPASSAKIWSFVMGKQR